MSSASLPRLGLVQMTSTNDPAHNLATALAFIEQAAAQGVTLLAFPEVFLLVGTAQQAKEAAQPLQGPEATWVNTFAQAAQKHGMWLLLGSLHERIADHPQGKVHNTAVLLDDQGALRAIYRKRQLFNVNLPSLNVQESDLMEPGQDLPPVIETPLGRVGLGICFDLRFSAHFAALRRQGAEVILLPANFTHPTGAAHWEPLLRSRAIETQCYVGAPAQTGTNQRYTAYGHTLVADPWGAVVAQASEGEGLVVTPIDLERVQQVRARIPMADSTNL